MRFTASLVLTVVVLLCQAGCTTSSPAYVKAEVFCRDSDGPTTIVTDEDAVAGLVGALPPGVGTGQKSDAGVFGVPTHHIRLTRDTGKVDWITIYNNGAAWSEGRGDWPLPDAGAHLERWLASARSEQLE